MSEQILASIKAALLAVKIPIEQWALPQLAATRWRQMGLFSLQMYLLVSTVETVWQVTLSRESLWQIRTFGDLSHAIAEAQKRQQP